MSDTPNIPAAWYDDPTDPSRLRYWDGTAWTENYAPKQAAPAAPVAPAATPAAATAPAYGAVPAYAAPQPLPITPVVPGPLMVAGALLIVSGLARMITNFALNDLVAVTVGAVVESLGIIGAFVAFVMAGFPNTRTAARALSFTQIAVYALALLLVIAGAASRNIAFYGFAGFLGLLVLGVGIAFGVVALRTPGLERRLAVLPLALYLGLLLFGLINAPLNASASPASWIVIGVSGLVPIAVGALFLLFGRAPQSAGAAAVGGGA